VPSSVVGSSKEGSVSSKEGDVSSKKGGVSSKMVSSSSIGSGGSGAAAVICCLLRLFFSDTLSPRTIFNGTVSREIPRNSIVFGRNVILYVLEMGG
jgi:hypothetical protein